MIIGLTGGIASGKTFCSDFFHHQGIPVVDADVISREVVAIGSPLLQSLRQLLGEAVLLPDGSLHRSWLREQIFADVAVKTAVNALMHPAIQERASQALSLAQQNSDWVLYSVPLLFENRLDTKCDAVIVVDILPELQLARGTARDGVSEAQIRSIMAAQCSREERLSRANVVIDNSSSRENTLQQCRQCFLHFNLQSSMLKMAGIKSATTNRGFAKISA